MPMPLSWPPNNHTWTTTLFRSKHSKWTGRPSPGSIPGRTSTTRRAVWRWEWECLRSEGKGPGAPMVTELSLSWSPAARWGWRPVLSLTGGSQQRYHPLELSRGGEDKGDHYYIIDLHHYLPVFITVSIQIILGYDCGLIISDEWQHYWTTCTWSWSWK